MPPCEEHPNRLAVSRENIGGIRQRRCYACDARDRTAERSDLAAAGLLGATDDVMDGDILQLCLELEAA